MTARKRGRRVRDLHDGDVLAGPFDLGWADNGTRLRYPYIQTIAPERHEAPAGYVVVRLLDDDFNQVGPEQVWPTTRLTHLRGIRRLRSRIGRGPKIG